MPTEDECASPTRPSSDDPMKDTEGTEPSQKKAKSSQHVPGHGASSKSQHGPDDFQGCSSGGAYSFNLPPFDSDAPYQGLPLGSHYPSGSAMPSGPPPMSSSSAGPTPGAPFGFNSPPFGSHFPSGGGMPSGPPTMSSGSAGPPPSALYHKDGYSVVITNGFLYHSSDDKGVVMMKSGTQFLIAITNDNSHGK